MAFRIHGEVSLDGAMFKRGLSEVGGQTTEFLKRFALGAVGIASVEQAFEKTIDSANELVNASRKLDVTVEQLQVLRQAAEENGLEFDSMTKALERFNAVRENILEGGKGSAQQIAALRRLGVTPQDLISQTGAQSLMGQISQTAQKSNAADIANDLKQIFGRGGMELFGTLKTNFDALGDKMKESGAIMSEQVAVKLKALGEEYEFISRIIISQLAPSLLALAQWAYKISVRATGAVAGAGSYWGAVYSHFADRNPDSDFLKSEGDPNAQFRGSDGRINFWKELWSTLKSPEASGAYNSTVKGFDLAIDEFNKTVESLAKLNPQNQKPIAIEPDSPSKRRAASHGRDDSLIESGNFLGSASDSIGRIAQQHLEVAKKQLDKLTDIDTKLGKNQDAGDELGGVDFGG